MKDVSSHTAGTAPAAPNLLPRNRNSHAAAYASWIRLPAAIIARKLKTPPPSAITASAARRAVTMRCSLWKSKSELQRSGQGRAM